MDLLKQMNLLVQPIMAEAWAMEKVAGGVGTSISVAERGLRELRGVLPFLSEAFPGTSKNTVEIRHANFALLGAELHNKVADLYFYKGRQLVTFDDLESWRADERCHKSHLKTEGYLRMAHYHYALALHELRRYVSHRRMSSVHKLNPVEAKTDTEDRVTLRSGGWPDFVFRSAGGSLLDLSESMFSRVSLFGLYTTLGDEFTQGDGGEDPDVLRDELRVALTKWFENGSLESGTVGPEPEKVPLQLSKDLEVDFQLQQWLGSWQEASDAGLQIYFNPDLQVDDRCRLVVSVNFMLVATKYLETGGYLEDASRELMNVCEVVTHHLWWYTMTHTTVAWLEEWQEHSQSPHLDDLQITELKAAVRGNGTSLNNHSFWLYLIDVGLYALEKAGSLFKTSRRADKSKALYLVGDKIPTFCLTLACSLGLVSESLLADQPQVKNKMRERLRKLIESWTGEIVPTNRFHERLQKLIASNQVRHSYPMINRLYGLKILIDSAVLCPPDEAEWPEEKLEEIKNWTLELLELRSRSDSPMHFTPLQSGATAALVYLRCRREMRGWDMPDIHELTQIRRSAVQDLSKSEEMCTMRRGYYETIQDLYYLYDDFNDRRVHFNHAVQMAGNELASLLRTLAHVPDIRLEEDAYVTWQAD